IFVHDRLTGETTRVSVSTGGGQAKKASHFPSISADGRCVAFESYASNLVPGDTNGSEDIFVHDRLTGETTRVSVSTGGGGANGPSGWPSISAEGRYVAFIGFGWADNLVPGDTNDTNDIFVHDRLTGQTTRVSVATGGGQANDWSEGPSISADGRYVAFHSSADNLVPGDTNGHEDIFVHDRLTGETTRVSVATGGGQANQGSWEPSISADGRYVAFHNLASNLVPGDTNGSEDVFVHDRVTGQTTRVSVSTGGGQANGESGKPSISADGRYVAFESLASNLVPGDTNGVEDIFVHDRGGGTTAEPGWVVTHTIPGDVYLGMELRCRVSCYNTGGVELTNVEVGLEVPEGFSVENVEPTGLAQLRGARPAQGSVYYGVINAPILPVGGSVGAEFTVVPPVEMLPQPSVSLKLHKKARAGEVVLEEDEGIEVVLQEKAIVLAVQKFGPDQVRRGEGIIYHILLWNLATDLSELALAAGQDVAESMVLMEDRLPPEVEFVRMEPEGIGEYVPGEHMIRWYLDKVAEEIGKELAVRILTRLRPDVPVGAIVEQMVNLPPMPPSVQLPVRYQDRQARVETLVVGAIDPNHIYVSPEGSVVPTTRLAYTIEYENIGNIAAEYVKVQTRLDPTLDEGSLETLSPHPVYDPATRTLTWEFHNADLKPKEARWLHYTARVRGEVADGTQVKGQARIWFDQEDPLDTNEVVNEVRRLVACDLNGDGKVDAADLAAFLAFYRQHLATGAYEQLYDVFPLETTAVGQVRLYDGRIDHEDARVVIEACLSG
ncbi:MAG: TolB family protein, partial [Armatimonadota bacterium]